MNLRNLRSITLKHVSFAIAPTLSINSADPAKTEGTWAGGVTLFKQDLD